MTTLLALLLCVGAAEDQAVRPKVKPAQPFIPIPIPNSPYAYRLHTDWTPLLRTKQPVWRYATRVEGTDRWEEAECGRVGRRFRTLIARSDDTTTEATAGRRIDGDGGIGEGSEWKVYVGGCYDARLGMEFTPAGPRIVLSVTHWPIDGREIAVGWNVLDNELVRRHGWHFDAEDINEMWLWHVWIPVMKARQSLLDRFR